MGLLDASATMTVYDSIERGAADECEPLRGRRPRTFTLTRLLVACVAVGVCAIGATTVVNTHLVNIHEDSALANFDLGSAVDDDSAHANFDDDYPEGAQLGWWTRPRDTCGSKAYQTYQASRSKCYRTHTWFRHRCFSRAAKQYKHELEGCKKKLPPPPENEKLKAENEKLKAENEKLEAENEKLKAGTKNCDKSDKTPKTENEKPKVKTFKNGGNLNCVKKYSDTELIEALKNMTCKEACDNDCKRFNSKRGYGSTSYTYMYPRCLNQHYSYNFAAKIYGERVVRNNPQYSPQEQKTFGGPGCLSKCPKF